MALSPAHQWHCTKNLLTIQNIAVKLVVKLALEPSNVPAIHMLQERIERRAQSEAIEDARPRHDEELLELDPLFPNKKGKGN
jgi:hypothetical protein